MFVDLALVIVALAVGMWMQWYLMLRRPFPLHIMLPAYPPGSPVRNIVSFNLPFEMWRYANGNAPLQLQINDDGLPPTPSLPPAMVPQPPEPVMAPTA